MPTRHGTLRRSSGARAPSAAQSRICSTSRGSSPASYASMSAPRSRAGDPGWIASSSPRPTLRIRMRHPRPGNCTVAGDPERLQQVVESPLQCRQVHADGGRVEVVLRRSTAHVEVALTDTARASPQVPAAHLPAVRQRTARHPCPRGLGSAWHRAPHRRAARGERPRESAGAGKGRLHGFKLPHHATDRGRGSNPDPKVGAPTNGHEHPALNGCCLVVM